MIWGPGGGGDGSGRLVESQPTLKKKNRKSGHKAKEMPCPINGRMKQESRGKMHPLSLAQNSHLFFLSHVNQLRMPLPPKANHLTAHYEGALGK